MEKIFKSLAIGKSLIQRAMSYVGIINSFLIVFTFKKVYEIQINSILILFFGFFVLLIVGLIDYYFILKHEYEHNNNRNDLKNDSKKIIKELEEIKIKLNKNGYE